MRRIWNEKMFDMSKKNKVFDSGFLFGTVTKIFFIILVTNKGLSCFSQTVFDPKKPITIFSNHQKFQQNNIYIGE